MYPAWAGMTAKNHQPHHPQHHDMNKGCDLLVAALENEGVERILGIPGEETSTWWNRCGTAPSGVSCPVNQTHQK